MIPSTNPPNCFPLASEFPEYVMQEQNAEQRQICYLLGKMWELSIPIWQKKLIKKIRIMHIIDP
jgi:hypothetical protein